MYACVCLIKIDCDWWLAVHGERACYPHASKLHHLFKSP